MAHVKNSKPSPTPPTTGGNSTTRGGQKPAPTNQTSGGNGATFSEPAKSDMAHTEYRIKSE